VLVLSPYEEINGANGVGCGWNIPPQPTDPRARKLSDHVDKPGKVTREKKDQWDKLPGQIKEGDPKVSKRSSKPKPAPTKW
jgi:hypothetical protein